MPSAIFEAESWQPRQSHRERMEARIRIEAIPLGQVQPAVTDLVLQTGGELVDVGGRDVATHAVLKERCAVTADSIAADLQKQSVYRIGIEFLWGQAHDFTQST